MNDKTDSSTTSEANPIADALVGDQSLETVRDILFGKQARETDRRSKQLEELFSRSIDKLGKELDRQVNRIEKNIDKLTVKLEKQSAKTAEQVKEKFAQTTTSIKELEKATKADQSAMHKELTAGRMELEIKTVAWIDELANQLESVHQQLLYAKTDRSSLSDLLHGMADAISADPPARAKSK